MNTIKSSLKSKEGMALPGVLVIFMAFCLLASAMYMMAMTSLREVRYLSANKKAEYLAQAGVEAAAFAYQTAVNLNTDAAYSEFITSTSTGSAQIESNVIYMVCYPKGSKYLNDKGQEVTREKIEYGFLTESQLPSFIEDSQYGEKNVIGSYQAILTNDTMKYDKFDIISYDADTGKAVKQTTNLEAPIKVIRATGTTYGGDVTRTKTAYLPDPKQGLGLYYGPDGVIDYQNADYSGNFVNAGTFNRQSSLKVNTNNFGSVDIKVENRAVPIQMGYCAGNMILGAPTKEKVNAISLQKDQDNIIVFAGMNDLFAEAGIDVTPTATHFNYLFLRGNNIVVNGNIEMYAYCFTRNTNVNIRSNIGKLVDVIARKYRFGTVIIGTPSKSGTTVVDPVHDSDFNFGDCGRIYFGGNVFVNIEFPNVGVFRYKAFSAGDVYYYNDDLPRSDGDTSPYGIDLFKYFLDYSIANKSYSEAVLKRFQDVIDTYYENTGISTVYVTGDGNGNVVTNSMRKIDRDTYSEDKFSDLIPPDPTGSSALVWESVNN